jgi:hypothetical protein
VPGRTTGAPPNADCYFFCGWFWWFWLLFLLFWWFWWFFGNVILGRFIPFPLVSIKFGGVVLLVLLVLLVLVVLVVSHNIPEELSILFFEFH